jgi:SWI/SNF-related matrix-associated actin-dependent regulator 1 of chromatin subfamily A
MEMVALLNFIEPDLFRDHFEDLQALFNQKVSLRDVSNGALLFGDRVARARTILEPFILQRRKEQVLQSLPAKTSRIVYCDLDSSQKPIYEDYERRFKASKEPRGSRAKPKGGRDNDNNNVWVQLRKSAIHAQLFRKYYDDGTVEAMAKTLMREAPQEELRQENLTHLTNELKACSDFELHLWCRDFKCISSYDVPKRSWMKSGKVQELLRLVRQYEENGDRVLVFTRWAKLIEILAECLASEKVNYRALQGSTDVGGRQSLIDEYNNNPSITVFLLTTAAGGTGINLTAANKVIIFDQSDNPQDDVQAENRAHRLGQTRDVEIVRLISKGTIEELVYSACQKKLELANIVTGWAVRSVEMTSAEMEAAVRQEMKSQGNFTPPSSD